MASKSSIYKGQRFKLFGHEFEVKDVQYIIGYPDRATISCRPHCCTTPRHTVMEIPVDVLEKIIKE